MRNEMPVKRRDKGFEGGDDRNEAALLYCFLGRALTGRLSLHSVTLAASHSFPREELAEKTGERRTRRLGLGDSAGTASA